MTSAERPIRVPPRTTHRAVTHAPGPTCTGAVTSPMSVLCRWLPVVTRVSWDSTASCPIQTSSWLWIQTPSPIQQFAPT
ncbi:Uncharacterised protein [Mycobacteroides abscessus]|nr:Uncharacterised protein [Mycobacteroides abscessus]